MTHRRRQRPIVLALVVALLLLILRGVTAGHAQSVVVTNVYTTNVADAAQSPVQQFGSGPQTIYVDYTVSTPSTGDVGEVDINPADSQGPAVAVAPLDFTTAGNKYVSLHAPNGAFPDGGYCAVLKINDVSQTASSTAPYPFTVGVAPRAFTCPTASSGTDTPTTTPTGTITTSTVTPTSEPSATSTATVVPTETSTTEPVPTFTPTGTPEVTAAASPTSAATLAPVAAPTQLVEEPLRHFVVAISNSLRVHHFGTLRLYIHGTHGRSIPGVTVALDTRRLGMNRARQGQTDARGSLTFRNLWPPHKGMLAVTATKSGYASIMVELSIS